MKKQLQGISLILFGIMVMLCSVIDVWTVIVHIPRWIPGDLIQAAIFLTGFTLGIFGLVYSFKKDN